MTQYLLLNLVYSFLSRKLPRNKSHRGGRNTQIVITQRRNTLLQIVTKVTTKVPKVKVLIMQNNLYYIIDYNY